MDANGLRFWLLADEPQWNRFGPDPPAYDATRRALRLASRRALPPATGTPAEAAGRLERVPQTLDAYGTRAYWDGVNQRVMATGAVPRDFDPDVPILDAEVVTDLAMGYDGVLYVAANDAVVMLDRRNRWDEVTLSLTGFRAWRLAADPSGGVWVLDRVNRRLARVQGMPLCRRPYGPYGPNTFRPCEENPAPPVMTPVIDGLPDSPVAIACSPAGRLAILSWQPDGAARLHCLTDQQTLAAPIPLEGAPHAFSLTWLSPATVAVLLAGMTEAPAFHISDDLQGSPALGDFYPLRHHDGGPFLHGINLPPHYPTSSGSSPLHRLSLPSYARRGEASNMRLIDSGNARTVWHRLYIEAAVPPHCSIGVELASTDEPAAPVRDSEWHLHYFGEGAIAPGVPRGAWIDESSELPFQPGMLLCDREKNRTGLFTALIQRPGLRVRDLQGRYLWVNVTLTGDGRSTPELAAVRAYGSRFSYVDKYLPELYREKVFRPEADDPGPATREDFLERLLNNFESVLTPLEDRIAGAYLLTDARTVPDESLGWLASWIGFAFDPAIPETRRRRLLENAAALSRWRGTMQGLSLFLDIVSGGGVSGGEIILLEDFRLRRTFATILGAFLADEKDPLLSGLSVSGNSFVGDTLFLGEEHRKEFLALFSADLNVTDSEQQAIDTLFERLAYRLTVLVHQEVEPQDLGLIRRVVELETPAHVQSRVVTATAPFLVGASSLIGVDTYLARRPAPKPVRIAKSDIGVRDYIQGTASLDPRLERGVSTSAPPVADAGPDREISIGESFLLDGSGSRAAPGRRLQRFNWRLNN